MSNTAHCSGKNLGISVVHAAILNHWMVSVHSLKTQWIILKSVSWETANSVKYSTVLKSVGLIVKSSCSSVDSLRFKNCLMFSQFAFEAESEITSGDSVAHKAAWQGIVTAAFLLYVLIPHFCKQL